VVISIRRYVRGGHQFSFIMMSSGPFTACLNGNPVSSSWRAAGELGIVCSTFSMVGALDMRGRRRAVPAPRSKPLGCGVVQGAVGRGGRGAEGGGLAPRMMRRDLRELPTLPLLMRPMIFFSSLAKPEERDWEKSLMLPLLLRFCL